MSCHCTIYHSRSCLKEKWNNYLVHPSNTFLPSQQFKNLFSFAQHVVVKMRTISKLKTTCLLMLITQKLIQTDKVLIKFYLLFCHTITIKEWNRVTDSKNVLCKSNGYPSLTALKKNHNFRYHFKDIYWQYFWSLWCTFVSHMKGGQ
jgi:hypothetical protein